MQVNLVELKRLPLSAQFCKKFYKFRFSARGSSEKKFPMKLPNSQSLSDKWKLKDIDPNEVQKKINSLLSKTHNFLNEVASPLVNTRKPADEDATDSDDVEEIFITEPTIQNETSVGNLSLAAAVSIEQFSRMNGLTGKKMQKIFQALVPPSLHKDVRNLVEFCCFKFLSRNNSDIHLRLKETAFQRLIFITMLAWENPYEVESKSDDNALERDSLKAIMSKLVGEEAFVRIAPAVSGVADRSTVHNLFKALAADKGGISFRMWSAYVDELLRVHEEQKSYKVPETMHYSSEQALCISSHRLEVVLLWVGNILRPGTLTLTNKALYFEAVGVLGNKLSKRLDITGRSAKVEKKRIGPLESLVFDSAVSISSGIGSEAWVLEFIDLGGEMRRDIWHAYVSEVISLHKFIHDYGPKEDDDSMFQVYGAEKGKKIATACAISSIARLQALQSRGKLLDDPSKLVQFSYLCASPYGEIVCQTLAVSCWGGPLVANSEKAINQSVRKGEGSDEFPAHVYDLDGSIYLRQWMRSPSWASRDSISFWRNISVKGVVLSKHLVVADTSLVERAARTCRDRLRVAEKIQATIDAAKLEGIPSNIDLFKELVLPLTITAQKFEKLRRWEEPLTTLSFLAFASTITLRNLLPYVFPTTLIAASMVMLSFKVLKERGFLRRPFEIVAIRDQPPSNTIQQIIALKKAMRDVESFLQNLNVTLLKMRTIILSGQPQITAELSLVLLFGGMTLFFVPFKYIVTFILLDLFTRELEFRRETVKKFRTLLKARWDAVHAAPVVVFPYESNETGTVDSLKGTDKRKKMSDKNQTGG